jgi:hypothetical protein
MLLTEAQFLALCAPVLTHYEVSGRAYGLTDPDPRLAYAL